MTSIARLPRATIVSSRSMLVESAMSSPRRARERRELAARDAPGTSRRDQGLDRGVADESELQRRHLLWRIDAAPLRLRTRSRRRDAAARGPLCDLADRVVQRRPRLPPFVS